MEEVNQGALKFSDLIAASVGNKRIRINKSEDASRYFVARFNDTCDINRWNNPVTLVTKEEAYVKDLLENSNTENQMEELHWILKNGTTNKNRVENKNYISKKCALDTDVFFMFVENEEYTDAFPISSWHSFIPDMSSKTLAKFNQEFSNEQGKKEKSENDKKIEDILERLRQKEENEKPIKKRKETTNGKEQKKIEYDSSEEEEEEEDDYFGIKRQEKRRLKNLIKLKRGDTKEEITYVDSALAITTLRKNPVNWDYNDDGKKSDDEELEGEQSGQEEFEEEEEDNEDSEDELKNQESNLTSYGQAVRSLLKQQINDEEDDELNQYSDDDEEDEEDEEEDEEDEEEDAEEKKSGKSRMNKTEVNKERGKSHKRKREAEEDEESEEDDEEDEEESEEEDDEDSEEEESEDTEEENKMSKEKNQKKFNELMKEKFSTNEIQLNQQNCGKILLKIIEKNNGKIDISLLFNILNIKEKNESFLLIQNAIKNLCYVSSQTIDGKKIKIISVKSKFLSK